MKLPQVLMGLIATCVAAAPQPANEAADAGENPALDNQDCPSIPDHFRCFADSDCVVRDVGNCCGYYPMCANPSAELPDPCPEEGMVGVCGFPDIDSCRCGSQGGCQSLQNGNVVHGSFY